MKLNWIQAYVSILDKVKGKVFPVRFLNWAPCHEVVLGEWRCSSMHSLTLALDGGEQSASCPGHFTPRERAPGTHWIGGCAGPRASLDTMVKRNVPSPHRESNPRTPTIQTIAQHYTNWAIMILISILEASNNLKLFRTYLQSLNQLGMYLVVLIQKRLEKEVDWESR
jgi:hypothetical protein